MILNETYEDRLINLIKEKLKIDSENIVMGISNEIVTHYLPYSIGGVEPPSRLNDWFAEIPNTARDYRCLFNIMNKYDVKDKEKVKGYFFYEHSNQYDICAYYYGMYYPNNTSEIMDIVKKDANDNHAFANLKDPKMMLRLILQELHRVYCYEYSLKLEEEPDNELEEGKEL